MKYPKLIIALASIVLLMLIACVAIFLQNFHCVYVPDFSEWGSFGDFFWGLGTMLLTALSVYLMYKINSTIEYKRQIKDMSEIQRAIINEYKSLRDKCLFRDSSDVFHIEVQYIAPMESFIRELRGYSNIFPFLSDEVKARSLNILQERLRLLQDPDSLNKWIKENGTQEWELFYGIMYSHSEWILGSMTTDWGETVNKAFQKSL